MRVLVAGATGVLGRPLVAQLAALDHHVIALSRHPLSSAEANVEAVAVDALDAKALTAAVRAAKPDAVVHALSAIPRSISPRRMSAEFAVTNRLRTESTRTLIAAATSVDCSRIVTQSVAFAYDLEGAAPGEAPPADERAPLFRDVAKQWRTSFAAIEQLERLTAEVGGLTLRLGHLYGPGTSFAADGDTVAQVRARKFPLVGGGTSVFSFLHVHDAATAIASALTGSVGGVLNIVDDEPAPTREWVPALADLLGGKRPRTAPAFAVRLFGGAWAQTFMTRLRGRGQQPGQAGPGLGAELFVLACRDAN